MAVCATALYVAAQPDSHPVPGNVLDFIFLSRQFPLNVGGILSCS